MTDAERERLLSYGETPSISAWWLSAGVMVLVTTTCLSGLVSFPLRKALDKQDAILAAVVVGLGLAALLVMFQLSEWRKEKTRRQHRRLRRESLALDGVVEVYEVTLGRGWRVSGYAPGFHVSPQVVVELLPNLIAQLPAPTDEDMHEMEVRGVSSPGMPVPAINGTMPRDRVVVEWLRLPRDAEEPVLLSIRWIGEPIQPIGEVDLFMVPGEPELVDSAPPSSLWYFAKLVRAVSVGPWANPPRV
jgi:hypothetical protein